MDFSIFPGNRDDIESTGIIFSDAHPAPSVVCYEILP